MSLTNNNNVGSTNAGTVLTLKDQGFLQTQGVDNFPQQLPNTLPTTFTIPNTYKPTFNDKLKRFGLKTNIKAKNFIQNNPAVIGLASQGIDILGNSFSSNVENSETVNTIFGVGDSITNAISTVNPAAGMIAKFAMTGLKGLNTLGGSRTETFYTNQDTIKNIGGSYGGSVNDINQAASKSNKKYGLFSLGSKNSANELIREARRQQNIMTNISEENQDLQARVNDLSGLFYNMQLNGGVPQLRSAKLGAKINFIKSKNLFKHTINLDTRQVEEFKQGGIIDSKEEWEPIIELPVEEFKEGGKLDEWIPVIKEFQEGGKVRTLEELIEYAKQQNPRFIQRLSEDPRGIKFIDDDGNEAEGSHYMEWSTDDEGNAIVYPRIQEMDDKSLKFLNSTDAWNRALKTKNFLKMSPDEAKIFFAEDPEYHTAYKRGWPEFFKKFKQGGSIKESETPKVEETTQKNLIPEGALHKNKHHMENDENITKKGIPVIDNDGDQQAEIEKDEWTMTLELTKTIENLYHKFYNEDTKNSEKDQLAIQAGNIIVEQLLYNTDDRTSLISKVQI